MLIASLIKSLDIANSESFYRCIRVASIIIAVRDLHSYADIRFLGFFEDTYRRTKSRG